MPANEESNFGQPVGREMEVSASRIPQRGPGRGRCAQSRKEHGAIDIVVRDRTVSSHRISTAGLESQQLLNGRPARFRNREAFADLGSIELELIQPLEGQSIWSEFLAAHGPGIHHIRFNLENLEEVIAHLDDKGIGVSQEGAGIRKGTRWVNFDTEDRVGFTIEVMKPAPGTDGRTPRS